ncbi:ribose transport system ATP-binding protein [Rhizobium laguerreae]|uniref:Ribose transport system ATP-binding protein n=1 Tax=Rhizobium laguerreae TaxID=1076926 RepID=A0ABR6G7J2_9HYPH|nr:sugar ABC transporter ATP-binding protein [Rhizobium laguerreae]MBB3162223.1 ribose transport system ATP-binding protein [Rhizobium laguerreae]OOO50734.1 ABC transporter ATP-binding protein [Rhizobium laguerreae]
MQTVSSTENRVERLQITNVTKSFSGVQVLKNVTCSADAGEVVALLGANGAGKSTLMKILSGVYSCDAGQIQIDGAAVDITSARAAIASGIRLMPQELSVHPDLSVAENIALGSMPQRKIAGISFVDRAAMQRQATTLLGRLKLGHVSASRRMGSLSLPEQRIVEIARALAGQARILIMDKPTAALGEADAETLFGVIDALRADGVTIIYISHYLDEVFRLSDRIVVLRDGEVSGQFQTSATSHEEVLRAMLGSDLGDLFPAKSQFLPDETILTVEGLSLPGWLSDVSFSVRRGEVLGAFGLIGSGIEKVGRAIYGAEPRAKVRSIRMGTAETALSNPRASIRSGIGFVAAERKRQGLIANLTVRTNTTLPYLTRFTRFGLVDDNRERVMSQHWIRTLRVKTTGPEQEIRLLSGGNQQKVCLVRWLLGDPKLLILEEPTRGVDLGARREIYEEIRRLAANGLGILLVSSDAEEVAGLADRAIVFEEGRAVATLGANASAAELMQAAESHSVSAANELEKA